MYFITSREAAANAVFTEDDKTVAVMCQLTRWEQILLLSRMYSRDQFERLCFHRSLAGFHLMATFCSWIEDLPNLTRLEVTDAPGFGIETMGQFLKAVSRSRIRYLNVSGMALGSEGARLLCKAVVESGRIHTLRAERNMMQTGVRALLELDLRRLEIGDNDVHRMWWSRYIKCISPTIRRLGLETHGGIGLGMNGFKALGRYMQHSHMMELNLGGNCMPLLSTQSFCAGLVGHAFLTTLYLNGCQLQNCSLKVLASMLRMNQSLRNLHLHNNPDIDETGQMYLIDALQTNFTLTYIEADVLFSRSCKDVRLIASRIAVDEAEPVTAHLTRLVCFNQDLNLSQRFWDPKIHLYYPVHMQERIVLLIGLLSRVMPIEMVLHVLSFWRGLHFRM